MKKNYHMHAYIHIHVCELKNEVLPGPRLYSSPLPPPLKKPGQRLQPGISGRKNERG